MEKTTMAAAAAAAALPDDLLAVILGRLPARSLAASCRVCKAWRDLIAERHLLLRLRRVLPHSVRGLFIYYEDYERPHFLSRPTPTPSLEHDGTAAGHLEHAVPGTRRITIDGEFDFIPRSCPDTWHDVVDHCNGLVLLETAPAYRGDEVLHVCNPATRWSARLPLYPGQEDDLYWGCRRAFLVFDPFVSPKEYKVLLSPPELEEEERPMKDARRRMEWPPAAWTAWHEFSSSTGRWVEKTFVREGEAAGTAGDLVLDFYHVQRSCWRYAAYWDGALYIHCRGEFVSRFSLLDDKYRVIKSPIQLTEFKDNVVQSFIGRSAKGVYFAAIVSEAQAKLRVWTLNESGGQVEWVPKDQNNLKINATYCYWDVEENNDFNEQKFWILDHGEGRNDQDVALVEQNVSWNSDDDDNIVVVSDDKQSFYTNFKFLGFHPCKEIIFLCCEDNAVAFHLNTPKAQYLGRVCLRNTYNCGLSESFVYTPCLIGD